MLTCKLTWLLSWQEYDERQTKNLTAVSNKEYDEEIPSAHPMPLEFLDPPRSAAQDLMASPLILGWNP